MASPEFGHDYDEVKVTWQQVSWQIYNDIVAGNLPLGSELPFERDLAKAYSANRIAMRQALIFLKKEGMIFREPDTRRFICHNLPDQEQLASFAEKVGPVASESGDYLIDPFGKKNTKSVFNLLRESELPTIELDGGKNWKNLVKAYGYEPTQEIKVSQKAAPSTVADLLEIRRSALVVAEERHRFVNGTLYDETSSYFLPEHCEELGLRGRKWAIEEFERVSKVELTASRPNSNDRTKFGLDPRTSTSIMKATITSYDSLDRPIRVQKQTVPSDRKTFVVFRRR